MSTPTVEEWEDDSVPSVVTRTASASGWTPTPSAVTHRGPYPSVIGIGTGDQQDFSILGILEAQKGAKLVHQLSLVTVLYNLMKTKNSFDLNIIAQNDLEKMVCEFQREGSRWTFLMQAAYWNNDSVARWLFQQGANPFLMSADNQTALDIAIEQGNMQVAETIRIKMGELEMQKRKEVSKPIDIAAARRMQQSR